MQVYTLPGLELVLAQRLEEALTFPWAWTLEPAQLARLCATDPTGQLALVILASSPLPTARTRYPCPYEHPYPRLMRRDPRLMLHEKVQPAILG